MNDHTRHSDHLELDELWDDARDGLLTPGEQKRFEALLADSVAHQRLWRSETQWLDLLAEPEAALAESSEASAFTERVIRHWEHPAGRLDGRLHSRLDSRTRGGAEHGTDADAVVARIGWHVQRVAAVAAAVALLVMAGWFMTRPPVTDQPGNPIVQGQPGDPPDGHDQTARIKPGTPDPVASLVGDFSRQYADSQGAIQRGIDRTKDAFKLDNVLALINDLPVPDPAEYMDRITQ